MPDLKSAKEGVFFVFEGADGVGKSTQARLLSRHIRKACGRDVLFVREPGGTPLGEKVRKILLHPSSGQIDARTEMFLFMAARAHLTLRRIIPALEKGTVVVCDRYLWSSVVYQGIAGGLGKNEVLRIGRIAGAVPPSRTFLIDLSPRAAYGRLRTLDRMENKGRKFQEKVRRGFLKLARQHPRNVVVIDGRGSEEAVHRRVLRHLPEAVRSTGSK